MITALLASLKAKVYALIAILTIAFLAYVKWLKVSNEAKDQKIEHMKKEIEIAKSVSKDKEKAAEFRGSQKEIDKQMQNVAQDTETEDDKRRFNEVTTPGTTNITA